MKLMAVLNNLLSNAIKYNREGGSITISETSDDQYVRVSVAANIVPDEAVADFYFRASTKERVTEVIEKVKKIAEGAALMTGATLEMERYELPYDDLKTNEKLSEMFNENLRALGITDINPGKATGGSSDIGNVSHVAPTIHPYIGITDCPMIGHSVEMAK